MKRRLVLTAGLVLALGALSAGIAVAAGGGSGDDADRAITGAALDEATAAALDHTGGGRVTGTEVDGDGRSRYEVEVTLEDGRQIEVELDEHFNVLGASPDPEHDDDRDPPDGG